MPVLRDYQLQLKAGIYEAWQSGAPNVLAVSPTGSGKTELKGSIFSENPVPSVAIAHRQELVSQISKAMAKYGVYHRIIAPKAVIQFCITQHVKHYGRSYHNNNANASVAGVDTLIRRTEQLVQYFNQIRLWDIDEAHHVLRDNKWGKAVALFRNAYGLGLTATPVRADRKALGVKKSGVFHKIVLGPTPRELVNRGYLSDYICFGPPQSIDLSKVLTSDATGDYQQDSLRKAAHKSTITGDMIKHYIALVPGKRAISFVVDVEIAIQTSAAFNSAGVPSAAVSAETPDHIRTSVLEKLARGELLNVVNVGLFGEGTDVPVVEVVQDGAPTQSYASYAQRFGRMMRPIYCQGFDPNGRGVTDADRLASIAAGPKPFGIYVDHVGNLVRHQGPPDRPRLWSLDDIEAGRRGATDDDVIPVTSCVHCFRSFPRVTSICPFCGLAQPVIGRGSPAFVDGDLTEYSPELLAAMRGEVDRIDGPALIPRDAPPHVVLAIKARWRERQEAQAQLRECIALWAGIGRDVYGRSDSEMYRRFYHIFGIDVATAKTLGTPDALKLTAMVREKFT